MIHLWDAPHRENLRIALGQETENREEEEYRVTSHQGSNNLFIIHHLEFLPPSALKEVYIDLRLEEQLNI